MNRGSYVRSPIKKKIWKIYSGGNFGVQNTFFIFGEFFAFQISPDLDSASSSFEDRLQAPETLNFRRLVNSSTNCKL